MTIAWLGNLLKVSLTPMRLHVKSNSTVRLTCSYEYDHLVHINFRLAPMASWPVTGQPVLAGPQVRTPDGAWRTFDVTLGSLPFAVECNVVNENGTVLAKIVSNILPGLMDLITSLRFVSVIRGSL